MSYQLVIAEKPSVARSIAGVIGADQKRDGYMEGNGYLVSWCIGHLVSLADAGAYDERFKKWRYDDLPILPQEWQYIIPAEKKGQFAVLRSLMERPDVTGLVCATDAGREGKLIFRFVYQMAGCKKPFKRLWISSMEDAAIREGFAHLKLGADYDDLYQSALCRAQADWLVGINATRLFSVLYGDTLNVGRVMTPTLALPTLIAIASAALMRPALANLAVLGEISISGTIIKTEDLANVLQVCLDSGAKKVLLPITSAADLGSVPPELVGAFSLIFYSSPQEAVFKALGVE